MAVTAVTLPNDIGLIEVEGSFVSEEEAAELRRAVAQFVASRRERLLIDLGKVTYMNSTAVGVIVAAYTSYAKREWQLRLCAMNKQVHLIFTITNLLAVFSVYDTREAAMESFSQART